MKLGFLTNYSEEEVKFAAEVGFKCLELSAGPGSALDADKVSNKKIDQIMKTVDKYGIEISALGYYTDHLDAELKNREERFRYFSKLIDLCAKLKVGVLCTFPGRGTAKGVEDNVAVFKEVFTPHVEKASQKGVKIAFENCHGGGGSSLAAWDAIFDAIPTDTLGLEFDPSHLLWQGIDYIKAARDYGKRIYHIHAKDTEILKDQLGRVGILGQRWWRFRIPGWGDVDWKAFISTLHDVGYTGNLDIEHEDPVFHGARHREGLILGYKHLSKFVA